MGDDFKRNSDMEYLADIPVIKEQLRNMKEQMGKIGEALLRLNEPLNKLVILDADIKWLKWWNNIEVGAIVTIGIALVLMIFKLAR